MASAAQDPVPHHKIHGKRNSYRPVRAVKASVFTYLFTPQVAFITSDLTTRFTLVTSGSPLLRASQVYSHTRPALSPVFFSLSLHVNRSKCKQIEAFQLSPNRTDLPQPGPIQGPAAEAYSNNHPLLLLTASDNVAAHHTALDGGLIVGIKVKMLIGVTRLKIGRYASSFSPYSFLHRATAYSSSPLRLLSIPTASPFTATLPIRSPSPPSLTTTPTSNPNPYSHPHQPPPTTEKKVAHPPPSSSSFALADPGSSPTPAATVGGSDAV